MGSKGKYYLLLLLSYFYLAERIFAVFLNQIHIMNQHRSQELSSLPLLSLGSLSKDDGCYGYGYATKQEYHWLKRKNNRVHVQHEFLAFLCRTPQNNNVKSPNFRF